MGDNDNGFFNLKQVPCSIHFKDNEKYRLVIDDQIEKKSEDIIIICDECLRGQSNIKCYAIKDAINGMKVFLDEHLKQQTSFLNQLKQIDQEFDLMLTRVKQTFKERIELLKKLQINSDIEQLNKYKQQKEFTSDELKKFLKIQRKYIVVSQDINKQPEISQEYLMKEAQKDMLLDQISRMFKEINKQFTNFEKLDINLYFSKLMEATKLPIRNIQQHDESIILNPMEQSKIKQSKKVDRLAQKQNQTVINQQRVFYAEIKKTIRLEGIYFSSEIDFVKNDTQQAELEFKIYNKDNKDDCHFQQIITIRASDQNGDDIFWKFQDNCQLEANQNYTFSILNKSKPIKCRLFQGLNNQNEEIKFVINQNPQKWENTFYETDVGLIKALQIYG